jgi:co-chaperonin GroES (HSP10)
MYRTDASHRRPRPVVGEAGEPGLDGVLEDVFERVGVLLVALDGLRVVAAAEHVVAEAPPVVEPARVAPVEVAHAEIEVGLRRLDDEVVVRSEEADRVLAPAVAAQDAAQEVQEDTAVVVVEEDEPAAVADGRDVVVGAGGEVAAGAAHGTTVAAPTHGGGRRARFGTRPLRRRHVPDTARGKRGPVRSRRRPRRHGLAGHATRLAPDVANAAASH